VQKAPRFCRKCEEAVQWHRAKIRSFAKRMSMICDVCGTVTTPIKGRRKKDTMPAGLYGYSMKVKQANDLWRHLIYRKAPDGKCAVCGTTKGLQAMHLFPKGRYPHLRFELDNGAPGCPGCHNRLTNDHERHRDFCIRYLGAERYEALRLRSICRAKNNIDLTLIYLRQKTDASDP
jgi:5-methylcytosine-specific restriction endonuclease McrA